MIMRLMTKNDMNYVFKNSSFENKKLCGKLRLRFETQRTSDLLARQKISKCKPMLC